MFKVLENFGMFVTLSMFLCDKSPSTVVNTLVPLDCKGFRRWYNTQITGIFYFIHHLVF